MLPERVPQVIHKSVADGAVLFHTTDEVYFGLNTVGARVWELLPPECATMDELIDRMREHYPEVPKETLREDVGELLDDLESHGLLKRPGQSEDAPAPQADPA